MFEDIEEAMAEGGRLTRRYCAFTMWAQGLEPADAAKAGELVDNREYSCQQLARYFRSKGAKVNNQVLNRHRNKVCCGR